MSLLIKKYPLDLTGRSPDNHISNEPQDLVDVGSGGNRVFVPNYGGFYTASLVIRDADGLELAPHSDYIATYLYEEATQKSGLEVCGAIVVINPNISSRVYIDYQVVGGDLAFSTRTLADILEALADETRPVEWANLIGKPEYFPPGGHLHALWELYGFEYLVTQLERVTQAIMTGDQAAMDELRDYAHSLYVDSLAYTDTLRDDFDVFVARTDNPHQVTKEQVGLGSVENFPIATEPQARGMTNHQVYMTPLRVGNSIDEHSQSGDHDHRYIRKGASVSAGIREINGTLQGYVDGAWRQIWPAEWV